MAKGKLIVCEGIDGSGKTEQMVLLQKRFKDLEIPFQVFDFPRYGVPPQGRPASYFVRKYLCKPEFLFTEGYGQAGADNPYAASAFYALDRFDAAFDQENPPNMIDLLEEEGVNILCNRYAQSNIGHQASKIEDGKYRKEFIQWLLNFEYNLLKIPRPDLVLLFNMPPQISWWLKEKQRKEQGMAKDAHELSEEGLKKSHQTYLEAAKMFSDSWTIINVFDQEKKQLRTIEEVHELAWPEVSKLLAVS